MLRPRRRSPSTTSESNMSVAARAASSMGRAGLIGMAGGEEEVRGPEAEQHQQVEVEQAEWTAGVEERQQEQQTEREPDVRRVQLAAEDARDAQQKRPAYVWRFRHFEQLARRAEL